MGSRKGSKNKRTLLREQVIVAAKNGSRDPYKTADSLEIMEWCMRYCFKRAQEEVSRAERSALKTVEAAGDEAIVNDEQAMLYLQTAVMIADKVARFRHPTIASARSGQDRDNDAKELGSEEAVQRLLRLMAATGKVPRVLQIDAVTRPR